MADLMSGSYTYEQLENKYGNFMAPAVKILAGGSDILSSLDLGLYSMRITLSLEAASSVEFRLFNCYDRKNSTFSSQVKDKLKPGTVLEIAIGYLKNVTTVFKGYVAFCGADFDEIPAFSVIAMDARRLMMTGGKKCLLHDVSNYSDAFQRVIGNYSKLCSPEVDATSDQLKKPISQMSTDYDFITRELIGNGRADREFFILGEKAYFRKPQKNKSPILGVSYGKGLLRLHALLGYLDLKVKVSGYDAEHQKAVSGEQKVSGVLSQSKVMSDTPMLLLADPDADTADKAKSRAEAIATKEKSRQAMGNGTLVGMPEVVPGRFLKIEEMDSMVDRKYYLSEVRHIMEEDIFVTEFDIGGVE